MKLTELLEIIEVETRIKPEWEEPAFLADLLPRLASLYASLGQSIADAEREADDAEIAYKVQREKVAADAMEEGKSAVAADKSGVIATEMLRYEWSRLKHKARLLFLARQSLDRTLDAIRSKLSYIKRDNPYA